LVVSREKRNFALFLEKILLGRILQAFPKPQFTHFKNFVFIVYWILCEHPFRGIEKRYLKWEICSQKIFKRRWG
jgi:hypothetical protein